jgi:hypothetical protein
VWGELISRLENGRDNGAARCIDSFEIDRLFSVDLFS